MNRPRRLALLLASTVLLACQTPGSSYLPAHESDAAACSRSDGIRRLTDSQYLHALQDLLPGIELGDEEEVEGTQIGLLSDLPKDGYHNNQSLQTPSSPWIERAHASALAVAGRMASWDYEDLTGCEPQDAACARQRILDLAARAYRRPLEDEDAAELEGFFDAHLAESSPRAAFALTLQVVLQSPAFLYVPEFGVLTDTVDPQCKAPISTLTGYELATRMALFLWDSVPDNELLAQAGSGGLDTAEGIRAQAQRMILDDRFERTVERFHHAWLEFDDMVYLSRPEFLEGEEADLADFEIPDGWNETTWGEVLEESQLFVRRVMFEQRGSIRDLLTGRQTVTTPTLASIYGTAHPGEADEEEESLPWQPTTLPEGQRRGILTLSGALASRAHDLRPSPVQRGVFVAERLLCRRLPPPPADIDTTTIGHSDTRRLTNRERYQNHSDNPACASCHQHIDPLGFAFENYTQYGMHRTRDQGQPVDASGTIRLDGRDVSFHNALELIDALAQSAEVRHCATVHWMTYAMGRSLWPGSDAPVTQRDLTALEAVAAQVEAQDGQLAPLALAIVESELFRTKLESP